MDRKKGFTLIELIIVATLVLILAGMVTTRFIQSFRERSVDYFLKEFIFFLRYVQFKTIEEGTIHKLALDPDSGELKSFVKSTSLEDFKEDSVLLANRLLKRGRFVLQLAHGNEVYFFPDGGVTPNQFFIMERTEEKASVDIKNRLGSFEVVRHD